VFQVTKEFVFDAAHRLMGYEGACRNIHGHTYHAQVTIQGDTLDELGLLVDFKEIKVDIGAWIDANWDHALLVNCADSALRDFAESQGFRLYQFKTNPTAEAMARELFEQVQYGLFQAVTVKSVVIYETPTSKAEYRI